MKTRTSTYPRRVCRHCQTQRCHKAEHVYCSQACAKAARRVTRPLCPVCHAKPTPCARQQTCSKVCGAIWRWRRESASFKQRIMQRATAGTKAAHAARLIAMFQAVIPELHAATSDLAIAQILGRIYKAGYHAGGSATHARFTADRRQA